MQQFGHLGQLAGLHGTSNTTWWIVYRHSPISSVHHKVDRHSPISSVHHKMDRHSPISSVHHNGTRFVQAGVDDGLGDESGHGHHDDLVVACVRVEGQP